MKIASLSEIKRELNERTPEELKAFCLRIAKFRKDNKELLNYLLFEAYDEENYKEVLKNEIEMEFAEMNASSVYLAKKSIRRILRTVTKHIKYSNSKQTAVELLIFFCQKMRELDLPYHKSKVLINLYNRQLHNIQKALSFLDEDLQFDYQSELEDISKPL
jgi:hypothetical protein